MRSLPPDPEDPVQVRVARKHGVEIQVVGKERLDDFMGLMETTGQWDGFNIRPKSYFERMLDSLGEGAALRSFMRELHLGAITTNFGGRPRYVYGASDNAHRNVMPNYLIQWEMIPLGH